MTLTDDETQRMGRDIKARFGADASALAFLRTRAAFHLDDQQADLLQACVASHAALHGIDLNAVNGALAAIFQHLGTAAYLVNMPD